jgi:hypothetical protein
LEVLSEGYKGRKGLEVDWFGSKFLIQGRGSRGGYEFLLQNGDMDLQMMPEARGGKPSPELRIIIRSEYIWRVGEYRVYDELLSFLEKWCVPAYCRVSRADLCVDRVMQLPEINRKSQVVSRAREKDLYYGGDFQRGQRSLLQNGIGRNCKQNSPLLQRKFPTIANRLLKAPDPNNISL